MLRLVGGVGNSLKRAGDRWLDGTIEATSLADFRLLAGLEAKRNGRRKRGEEKRRKGVGSHLSEEKGSGVT
jgi:hypothetical protein